jgi:hypothetical protein
MPGRAKTYVTLVIFTGSLVVLLAAGSWSSADPRQFAMCLGLAAFASTLKVRIPLVEGTLSLNFVFLLLGMVTLSFSEVVAVSLTAALVQSVWASAKPVRLVQVGFSASALILSSSLAYEFSRFIAGNSAVASVIIAGSIYLPLNSSLVSVVIGLVEGQPIKQVFERCYQWVFPYFMGGMVFAGLVSAIFRPASLGKGALVLLPAAVSAYLHFLSRSAFAGSITEPTARATLLSSSRERDSI